MAACLVSSAVPIILALGVRKEAASMELLVELRNKVQPSGAIKMLLEAVGQLYAELGSMV